MPAVLQVKPSLWGISPGQIEPKWGQFHTNLVGAWMPFSLDVPENAKAEEIVYDRSIHHNDGTLDNSSADLSQVFTVQGRALQFTGDNTNDRIRLGSTNSGNPLSLAGLAKCTVIVGCLYNGLPASSFPRIIDKSDSGNAQNGWMLIFNDSTDEFQFYAGNSTTSNFDRWDYARVLSVGDEFQIAFTTPNFPTTGQFYFDGLPVATSHGQDGTPSVFSSTTTDMAIGNWNHAINRMWRGRIDYVYVLNEAFGDSFFLEIYKDPFGPFRLADEAKVVYDLAAVTNQPIYLYHARHHNLAA